jgi:Ferritin-like
MDEKIFPRNLTARAAMSVVGNPVSSRLESGVGVSYPGLEFDHRNLDRRFFPGLVFTFVSQDEADFPSDQLRGAELVSIDLCDPELPEVSDISGSLHVQLAKDLRNALTGEIGDLLNKGSFFLESLKQGKTRISMRDQGTPLDGTVVWRLVRSLRPGPLEIILKWRKKNKESSRPRSKQIVRLKGWRRNFVDPDSGVIKDVFRAGELTQSMCSPWQHDFRDCGCHYWASNHPDIVLLENPPGEELLPDKNPSNPELANASVDWLRSDRSQFASVAASGVRSKNRPYQMDFYEINERWQDFSFVLEGREISRSYTRTDNLSKNPFDSPQTLAEQLFKLAELEHVLILEYLYAYFSIKRPGEIDSKKYPALRDDAVFAAHELLIVAVSEMRHLRWVNQLLWEMWHGGIIPQLGPSLGVAGWVPASDKKLRKRDLRILDPETLQSFIEVEQPSGTLDGQYARVIATFRLKKSAYPMADQWAQIAERIIADGVQHFSRFREIKSVLDDYIDPNAPAGTSPPYLRNLKCADPASARAKQALDLYRELIKDLKEGYENGDLEDAKYIVNARKAMTDLNDLGEKLALEGYGIPLFAGLPEPRNSA